MSGRLAFAWGRPRRWVKCTLLGISLLAVTQSYGQIDPFGARSGLDMRPPSMLTGEGGHVVSCNVENVSSPLTLYDAVTQALCNNPKVRHSWSNLIVNADYVGVAESAYLPTLDASLSQQRTTETSSNPELVPSSWSTRASTRNASVALSWVLFDFGRRAANLNYYRRLLDLAKASHENELQAVFEQAAEAFYTVWADTSALKAAIDAETTAEHSYQSAQRKHAAGLGTLNDELQARTAWQQAIFDRIDAAGRLKVATGTLCITMGLPVATSINIDADAGAQPDLSFVQSVDELLGLAQELNPKLRAARAQVEADQANAAQARRQMLPTVSLVGSFDDARGAANDLPGLTHSRSRVIGVQISIPLFAGFGQEYHRQASEVQVDIDRADLRDIELQVAMSVWNSYQAVTTKTEGLSVARAVLQTAQQGYDVASKRYAAGVGALLDVLTAQAALAKARYQIVQAQADWRVSRLQLALAIGSLTGWRKAGTERAEAP